MIYMERRFGLHLHMSKMAASTQGRYSIPPSLSNVKAAPHLNPPIRVPLGGREYHLPHFSAYSILLANPEFMEYVPLIDEETLPNGVTPVPAGCERDGLRKLYFATARVPRTFLDGIFGGDDDDSKIVVPGKWGEHLGGVMVAYGGREITVKEGGEVLCWKRR
jgi:hypothetical protein